MKPFVDSIEGLTETNKNFRRVLFTGKLMQLVVMSLKPLEEIGLETHPHTDQFFRIEKGRAYFIIGRNEEMVGPGWAVVVPAGTPHNIINKRSSLAVTSPARRLQSCEETHGTGLRLCQSSTMTLS